MTLGFLRGPLFAIARGKLIMKSTQFHHAYICWCVCRCTIHWNKGKDLTMRTVKKKSKGSGLNSSISLEREW